MPYARHELGAASEIRADAVGEPGNRRFRLLVAAEGGNACLWLEKEQLLQLALSMQQLLAGVVGLPDASELTSQASVSGQKQSHEFQIGKLVIGHDRQTDSFLLLAHDLESAEDRTATLGLWATQAQLKEFAEEALAVCAAGRPRCPLCGGPVGREPHVCPRSNGHAPPET